MSVQTLSRPVLFDPWASHADLLAKMAKLEPYNMGIRATPVSIEGRADYIAALTSIVANHVEEMAADAAASVSCGRVDDEDARAIADIGSDIAGQIRRCE